MLTLGPVGVRPTWTCAALQMLGPVDFAAGLSVFALTIGDISKEPKERFHVALADHDSFAEGLK